MSRRTVILLMLLVITVVAFNIYLFNKGGWEVNEYYGDRGHYVYELTNGKLSYAYADEDCQCSSKAVLLEFKRRIDNAELFFVGERLSDDKIYADGKIYKYLDVVDSLMARPKFVEMILSDICYDLSHE